MSEGEVLVSEGDESAAGEELLAGLPPWMPTDSASGNFKLLDVVGRAFDRLDADIENVEHATHVQEAETVSQLTELAKLVSMKPKQAEPREKYRSRVLSRFQSLTSEGTAMDLINSTATMLGIDPAEVDYTELSEHGVVQLGLPGGALDSLSMTTSEFVDIIGDQSAAGFRVEALLRGTFTYITPADYNDSGFSHDASRGYDGLDANGDPKGNGGTYAGLLD